MIDLYYWPTPNGWKITIMPEETGLPYRVVPVNIGRGEQFRAAPGSDVVDASRLLTSPSAHL